MALSLAFCPNIGISLLVDLVNEPTVPRPSIHLPSGATDSATVPRVMRNNGCIRG